MPKLPRARAARELDISYSTLSRRINLLQMPVEVDEDGSVLVDTDELLRRWTERVEARGIRRTSTGRRGLVNVLVDADVRAELDAIAEHHDLSLGEASRRILDLGLAAYYSRGARFDG